jgi:hypothetical protein
MVDLCLLLIKKPLLQHILSVFVVVTNLYAKCVFSIFMYYYFNLKQIVLLHKSEKDRCVNLKSYSLLQVERKILYDVAVCGCCILYVKSCIRVLTVY